MTTISRAELRYLEVARDLTEAQQHYARLAGFCELTRDERVEKAHALAKVERLERDKYRAVLALPEGHYAKARYASLEKH